MLKKSEGCMEKDTIGVPSPLLGTPPLYHMALCKNKYHLSHSHLPCVSNYTE
jgi:hypothetical protein